MSKSLKDLILAAEDLPRVPVRTPEWPGTDGKVFVRTMRADERDQYDRSVSEARDRNDPAWMARANLVVRCCVDGEGNRIFDNNGDVSVLNGKSAKVLSRLFNAAMKINGIGEDDLEELTKN